MDNALSVLPEAPGTPNSHYHGRRPRRKPARTTTSRHYRRYQSKGEGSDNGSGDQGSTFLARAHRVSHISKVCCDQVLIVITQDCHELAFFTLFSLLFYCIDICCYSLESYSNTNLHSLLSISPSNFVSDHQRKSNSACIQSHNVANTTLKTTTDGPFQTQDETTGLSNCPAERQDQQPPLGSANRHDRSLAN